MTDSEPDDNKKELPATQESRVSRIQRIINALSDFEQDEISTALQIAKMREYQVRMAEPGNALAFGLHTGIWAGLFFGGFTAAIALAAGLATGNLMSAISLAASTLLVCGFGFGIFCGIYMVLLIRSMTFFMKMHQNSGSSALLQVRKVEVPVPFAEAVELSVTAIGSKKGWRLEGLDRNEGTVRAVTVATVFSPGEIVGVKVDPLTEDSSMVSVYSKALFTAMDMGKNARNVKQLAKEIEEAGAVHSILRLQ